MSEKFGDRPPKIQDLKEFNAMIRLKTFAVSFRTKPEEKKLSCQKDKMVDAEDPTCQL